MRRTLHAAFGISSWVCLAALLSAAGWILSALHQLNRAGYAVVLLLGAGLGVTWWLRLPKTEQTAFRWKVRRLSRKLFRRVHRLFPALFLLLAVLAFAGGVIHAPTNGDALTQRIPRVLNWLAEGRWHWFDGVLSISNAKTCGFEWITAPLILFTGTDRWLFVINSFSFLLLPGLIFSLFSRMGIHSRVAWHWMWLLPTGYCFLLQAGSIANDALGAVFALAAVDFALRARESKTPQHVWLSVLAAGLMTGIKVSNAPLLLPWIVAVGPAWKCVWRRPVSTLFVILIAGLVSFLPTALLNHCRFGTWNPIGIGATHMQTGRAHVRLPLNMANLIRQNLLPPINPFGPWWNRVVAPHAPTWIKKLAQGSFEGDLGFLRMPELEMEEGSGLGLGVCIVLAASWLAARRHDARGIQQLRTPLSGRLERCLFHCCSYVALLVYMALLGFESIARLVTPYYVLLLLPWLVAVGQKEIIRLRWWRRLALGVGLMAVIVLILNPARPLWPASFISRELQQRYPESRLAQRLEAVDSAYRTRWDGLAPVRALLPEGTHEVGFMAFLPSSFETSLWRPFGSRRVRGVSPEESPITLAQRGLDYIVIGTHTKTTQVLGQSFEEWFSSWRQQHQAKIVARTPLTLQASQGSTEWFVVQLQPRDVQEDSLPVTNIFGPWQATDHSQTLEPTNSHKPSLLGVRYRCPENERPNEAQALSNSCVSIIETTRWTQG